MPRNLNELLIPNADGPSHPLKDYSTHANNVEVCFRSLDTRLIEFINEAEMVIGCVAWLTNFNILKALAQKQCSIVVQKEDFLRPDLNNVEGDWKKTLRESYEQLKCSLERYSFPGIVSELSVFGDLKVSGVRCVGNHNYERIAAFPRMHNKFLVACSILKSTEKHEPPLIIPEKVWSGSFNLSENATLSFENALIITCPKISNAYMNEFEQIYALSEGLDWTSVWVAPELRIGT